MAAGGRVSGGDANLRRLASNLRRDPEALAALAGMGVEDTTVSAFQLGLREPYRRTDGRLVERVLAVPVPSSGGRRRFACVNLPGLTGNPEHPVCWSPGRAALVAWPVGTSTLVVCGSPVEVWQLGQAAGRRGVDAAFASSTQPGVAPEEWTEPRYWAPWDRVVVTATVPAAVRCQIAGWARRPIDHAPGTDCSGRPGGPVADRHDEWLLELLAGGVRLGSADASGAGAAGAVAGDFAAGTLAPHGGYRDGRMYYPALVERRRAAAGSGAGGGLLHSYETVVVTSDGAVLEAEVLPAPAGTPAARRVHALTDGTRIDAAPAASRHATWSLASIQAFVAARGAGEDPCARPTAAVLRDVHAFLASRVTLPDADDLWLAAAYAALTHLARVFDAVPLLVAAGPKGSGKSELALAIAALGFNAVVMGQGSAAALVRLARDGGGLVVLDDAEGLGPDASGFGELAQALKLGYKSSTARKPVTLPTGRVATMDFYGTRVVTTTRGIEPVLGSRCLTIETSASSSRRPPCGADTDAVRDELHVIAMARAGEVEARYRESVAGASDGGGREDEVWAPLLTIAEVLGPQAMLEALRRRRSRVVGTGQAALAVA